MHSQENNPIKIFIIGLPRTGTTSISVAMLEAGFKVAHTAFTKQTFELAQVISDAPCFSDFEQLDRLYPNSKFIYLQRDLLKWIPSMQRLLTKMADDLNIKTGTFSPVLKRAFNECFDTEHNDLLSKQHLTQCYLNHEQHVLNYFKDRHDLLKINISHKDSYQQLCEFLNLSFQENQQFPHLNVGAQVAVWKNYKHKNKVSSHSSGKDHRQFFAYKTGRMIE